MKTILLSAAALLSATISLAQTKTFELQTIAEGNATATTPQGDVFITSTHATPTLQTTGQYQAANSTAGFNVLQDFAILGDYAIMLNKAGSYYARIVNYPSYTQVATVNNIGAPQSAVKVSNSTAYVSSSNPNQINRITVTGSATAVNGAVGGVAQEMIYANGFVYAAIASSLVKIDTATNAVISTINPGVGSIRGIAQDPSGQYAWALGGSSIVRVELTNNDQLSPAIPLSVTNAKLLRYGNNKLYFLSGKDVHLYDLANPVLPTTAVFTSTFTGSWDFAYGKAFTVDPVSGDFVVGSANAFTGPSLYHIVDGTTFATIATGSVSGAIGVNEFILKTYTAPTSITPSVANLPTIQGQCSATVSAPTATGPSGTLTGTTSSPLSYNTQGTYTLSWTYTDGTLTATQNQTVVVNDNTAPVPTQTSLATVNATCSVTLTAPTATDNCSGTITGTTTAATTYTAVGTYTLAWAYTDAAGNTATQTQTVVVTCNTTGIDEAEAAFVGVFPNPANEVLIISVAQKTKASHFVLLDQLGRTVKMLTIDQQRQQVTVSDLPDGIYYYQLKAPNDETLQAGKLLIVR